MANETEQDPRIEKLPKWAQEELRDKDRRIKSLEDALAAREGKTKTRIRVGYRGDEHAFYIPEGEPVVFAMSRPEGSRFRDANEVAVKFTAEGLTIQGDDGVIVLPRSTNVIHLRSER